jgi:hypothetical protein
VADIGQALDKEWDQMARSEAADEAARGWAEAEPALAGLRCVQDALDRRLDPKAAPGVMAALARLAPTDRIAARTLLQALLPGLACLTQDIGGGDADALDHLVALAWERIRTYPPGRPGSVPGRVLYDVRKRYRRERRPIRLRGGVPRAGETTPSAEELVLDRTLLGDVADAKRRGVISDAAFELILRTRIGEEFLYEMAAEKSTTVAILNQQRYRAERRLEFALG